MDHILFDGDVIVYRAAFASQKKVNGIVEAKEVKYALGTAKSIIKSVCKELQLTDYSVYLTSSAIRDNYRSTIAGLSKVYKANRKDLVKPVHYDAVREYLMRRHEAVMVTGEEADDRLGIIQCKLGQKTVIASIDKDLLQIPGWHYNTYYKTLTNSIDPGILVYKETKAGKKKLTGTGFKWFCAQMLLGDRVDNIDGISGLGDHRVFKLLKDLHKAPELWDYIKAVYDKHGKSPEVLIATAQLLWIRRKPDEMFSEDTVKELK
jgi:hypothetical protein